MGSTVRTPAPTLGHLLPRAAGVVPGAVLGHHHTEWSLHLHRTALYPQSGVSNTCHGFGELERDDLHQVLGAGVETSLLSCAEDSEDVL